VVRVVTFGEIMARVEPTGLRRIRQAFPGTANVTFAGAEANVAASIALLGGESRFVTALPRHTLADGALDSLRRVGVDTDYVARRDEGRLGLFFLEGGANQRASSVTYDREHTAISMTPSSEYQWDRIFEDAEWYHVTGITPALSEEASLATLESVRLARRAGLRVSIDLNFRRKLWQWHTRLDARQLAAKTMRQLLPYVDVVLGNEEDVGEVLGIHAEETDVAAGKLAPARYVDVAKGVAAEFSNVAMVGITLRESISASWNNWGAMLYDVGSQRAFFAPVSNGQYSPYEIRNIVDRVGGGDSFAAALIFALTTPDLDEPEVALRFAVAASCLAHSVPGDLNFTTRSEVERLASGVSSGRVIR